jgi:ABC-2 type transport system ATP-binding protein
MSLAELQLDGLCRRYGTVTALDGLSFGVPAGEVFGFLGPNGAGKTTAMRAIFGVTALDAGEIRWRGKPVDEQARRQFGYMPEERGLYPTMKLAEQVEYFATLHDMDDRAAKKAAAHWIGRLGLSGREDARIDALSHGNQQRAQLAVALVHDPELLVLDEPFAGLDPGGVDDMRQVLEERAAAGVTVLFSSHQLDLVEDICEAVAIIYQGRLVTYGPVADLRRGDRPRSDVNSTIMPVQLPLIIAYALSYTVIYANGANTFYHVLGFLPPTAPVAMPVLYAAGDMPLWQVVVSAALCAVATVWMARVAAGIYTRSMLRTGARVRLKEVLRQA